MPTDFSKVDKLVQKSFEAGLESLGKDVKKRAVILAPYDNDREEGVHLRSTAKVTLSARGKTVFISFNKPYANRRHWENYKNPSTTHYLTNALKSIKNVMKYFKKF